MRNRALLILGILAAVVLSMPVSPAFGQWGPYPYPYPPVGYPGVPGFFRNPITSVRLQVTPHEGLVYVDGYAAGMVDDFDGVFQRLQLIPGHHEIVVYLHGYRTLRQNLYLTPGSSHTIKHTLVPLAPGEQEEPAPVPLLAPGRGPVQGPVMPPPGQAPGMPLPPPAPQQQTSRFGTLSIRVQPGDATILVDSESWQVPQSPERLSVQLSEGAHHLRVEKAGFETFAVDVEVRAGETVSLNVSLRVLTRERVN